MKNKKHKQFLFSHLTRPEIKAMQNENLVVVIPVGATEQHGLHLPVDTDNFLIENLVYEAADMVCQLKIPVLVTPTIAFGASAHHMSFGATISLSQRTLVSVIKDVAKSLIESEFKRLFFVNGHGGNRSALSFALTELKIENPSILLASCSHWELASSFINSNRESLRGGIGHSCELETSLSLAFDERRVKKDLMAKNLPLPRIPEESFDLVNGGSVNIPFLYNQVSDTGVLGDPTLATKKKGRAFADYTIKKLADVISALSICQVESFEKGFPIKGEE